MWVVTSTGPFSSVHALVSTMYASWLTGSVLHCLHVCLAVRFGKYTPMRSKDKKVQIFVNGEQLHGVQQAGRE